MAIFTALIRERRSVEAGLALIARLGWSRANYSPTSLSMHFACDRCDGTHREDTDDLMRGYWPGHVCPVLVHEREGREYWGDLCP